MISLSRETEETKIKVELEINGEGKADINTGIGFFDHMLELMACHGFMNLNLKADGDLKVDEHHTVEDVGIVMGKALSQALGNKAGIVRYGEFTLPMDESLVQVVLDLSGRFYYRDNLEFKRQMLGDFPVELFAEFFRSLALNAGMNLHIRIIRDGNTHHMIEACFKAFGRALDSAVQADERLKGKVLSTKGTLGEGDA